MRSIFGGPSLMAVPFIFVAQLVFARAGGGHSFSGGSHGGGGYGGGGGGGGDLGLYMMINALWRLNAQQPVIGLFVDLILLWLFYYFFIKSSTQDVSSLSGGLPRRSYFRRGDLLKLHQKDVNFSLPYFADFTYSLYAEVHKARGAKKLVAYSSYLSDRSLADLISLSPNCNECRGIVVGGWRIERVVYGEDRCEISVNFETNYSELHAEQESRWYANEVWTFSRRLDVLSKAVEELRVLGCPNCGAALVYSNYRTCKSCGQKIESGEFNWFVTQILGRRELRPPLLGGYVAEQGTDLPTQYALDYEQQFAEYEQAHPEFQLNKFMERTNLIFLEIQKAWSERKPELARPYESDRIFESHLYWIEEYRRQGLRNALSEIQVHEIVPVTLQQDRFVVSLTVRIYASMIDVTVDERGKVIGGDPGSRRPFSEYWTFIRGQVAPNKPITAFGLCPACGAPMKIGMAGTCSYCNSQIATGNFDWVLSMIEQDESYEA